MAGTTVQTLVLRGIPVVVRGGVAVGTRTEVRTETRPNARLSLSMRHSSLPCRLAESDPNQWQPHTANIGGAAYAAVRAGRPGSRAGVPSRRSPAKFAGWTVPLQRSLVKRYPASPAWPLASKRWQVSRIASMRSGGTLMASTRGKGS
jgi:hypothetical protein